jgi:CIC family chloride channel protein
MIAVALAFIVQITITRGAKYPTIYEAQVATPGDSRVHREAYYRTVAKMLRDKEIHLDRDLLASELQSAMEQGDGVPLGRSGARMYHVRLRPGTPVAGQETRELGLGRLGVVILGVIRGESQIIPDDDTRLQVGDGLVVAARGEAIRKFEALVASTSAAPDEEAESTTAKNA